MPDTVVLPPKVALPVEIKLPFTFKLPTSASEKTAFSLVIYQVLELSFIADKYA